jgi:O-antigen/teichoic acid export membrane protein
VVFLIFARKLSVESYGQLITLFTLANIFITFFNLGLPIYLQREVAISKENSSLLLSKVISINLIVLVFYLLFTFIYYKIFYFSISLSLYLVTVVPIYLYSNINILNSVLSGLSRYKSQFHTFLNSRVITLLVFLFFTFFLASSYEYLLIIYSLGFLYHIILLAYKIKDISVQFFVKVNLNEMLEVIKVSFPLGMAVIFNFLYDKIDILIISKLTDFTQVGYYNIGYGIYKASSVAFAFLLVSGLTKVSYLSRRKSAVLIFFKKYSLNFLIIGIIINVVLFFMSDLIIKIIYTDKFEHSILILKITSFAVIGLALNNFTGVVLNGLGRHKENMYVTFSGLTINIFLNIIFIPLYGIIAAAVVSIVTEYFILTGDLYFILRLLKKQDS